MFLQNLKIVLVVIVTLGLYTWVANAIPQVESEVPSDVSFGAEVTAAELVSAGEVLYSGAGACTTCHGLDDRAPALLADYEGEGPIGQRCGSRVAGQDCKTYLYESLVNPNDYLVEPFGPIMPDQRINLSEQQLWALVAYLEDQGGEVTVTAADLQASEAAAGEPAAAGGGGGGIAATEPMEILRQGTCMGCHVLGDEGTELGPSFDEVGARLSADQIRSSILDPNAQVSEGFEATAGVMPPNFGSMLTAQQLETVVQFLAEQR